MHAGALKLEGVHCAMQVARPAAGVVVLHIDGVDIGELGCWPFEVLAEDLRTGRRIDLFIDARNVKGASMEVSGTWAAWLLRHRQALRSVTMLTRSPLVRMTARFVRRFAKLGTRMRITDDDARFEGALAFATLPG
jgi:hypothetical protein